MVSFNFSLCVYDPSADSTGKGESHVRRTGKGRQRGPTQDSSVETYGENLQQLNGDVCNPLILQRRSPTWEEMEKSFPKQKPYTPGSKSS